MVKQRTILRKSQSCPPSSSSFNFAVFTMMALFHTTYGDGRAPDGFGTYDDPPLPATPTSTPTVSTSSSDGSSDSSGSSGTGQPAEPAADAGSPAEQSEPPTDVAGTIFLGERNFNNKGDHFINTFHMTTFSSVFL